MNPRLVAWDGEKTLTLTIEDALLSPVSFAMLSGAGLVHGKKSVTGESNPVYVHATYDLVAETVKDKLVAKLTDEERNGAVLIISKEAPVYPVTLDSAGAQANFLSAVTEKQVYVLEGDTLTAVSADGGTLGTHGEILAPGKTIAFEFAKEDNGDSNLDKSVKAGDTVRIDCYEVHYDEAYEMQIDAENFAGYYYIEASTLFRDEETGVDLPAEFVIPRGKIQSNFTFTMANSGDPSTFTFTIDCMPAYTKFNKKKKIMATLQVVDQTDTTHNYKNKDILGHENRTADSDVDGWYSKSVFSAEK